MVITEKSFVVENITSLPDDFLKKLMELLNDEHKLKTIFEIVEKTGITFERNKYQITFNCREEIYAAKDLLEIKFKKDTD